MDALSFLAMMGKCSSNDYEKLTHRLTDASISETTRILYTALGITHTTKFKDDDDGTRRDGIVKKIEKIIELTRAAPTMSTSELVAWYGANPEFKEITYDSHSDTLLWEALKNVHMVVFSANYLKE